MSHDNKAIVLEGLDALFNRRDFEKAATLWSPDYIQHSRHFPAAGRGCSTSCAVFPEVPGISPVSRWPKAITW